MSRIVYNCPNHGGQAAGTMISSTEVRCDWLIEGWTSREVGFDKRTGRPTYEFLPRTTPGCGAILGLCIHGYRICKDALPPCKPNLQPGNGPQTLEPLASIIAREAEDRRRREYETRQAAHENAGAPRPRSPEPANRIQLPFLGEAEPTRYVPPRGRGGKKK